MKDRGMMIDGRRGEKASKKRGAGGIPGCRCWYDHQIGSKVKIKGVGGWGRDVGTGWSDCVTRCVCEKLKE